MQFKEIYYINIRLINSLLVEYDYIPWYVFQLKHFYLKMNFKSNISCFRCVQIYISLRSICKFGENVLLNINLFPY